MVKVESPSFSVRTPSGEATVKRSRAAVLEAEDKLQRFRPAALEGLAEGMLAGRRAEQVPLDRREAAANHRPPHAGVQPRVDRGEDQAAEQLQLHAAVLRFVVERGEDHVALLERELHEQRRFFQLARRRPILAANAGRRLGEVEGGGQPARLLEVQIDPHSQAFLQGRINHLGADRLGGAGSGFVAVDKLGKSDGHQREPPVGGIERSPAAHVIAEAVVNSLDDLRAERETRLPNRVGCRRFVAPATPAGRRRR